MPRKTSVSERLDAQAEWLLALELRVTTLEADAKRRASGLPASNLGDFLPRIVSGGHAAPGVTLVPPFCGERWTDTKDGDHSCYLNPRHSGPHECSCRDTYTKWVKAPAAGGAT